MMSIILSDKADLKIHCCDNEELGPVKIAYYTRCHLQVTPYNNKRSTRSHKNHDSRHNFKFNTTTTSISLAAHNSFFYVMNVKIRKVKETSSYLYNDQSSFRSSIHRFGISLSLYKKCLWIIFLLKKLRMNCVKLKRERHNHLSNSEIGYQSMHSWRMFDKVRQFWEWRIVEFN